MDRAILKRHLAQAEKHVALGESHIARQREIVSELARGGHDTRMAKTLLAEFDNNQVMHVAHRDQLRRELAELPGAAPT